MINKRIINTVEQSKKYIAINVFWQIISLIANIVFVYTFVHILYFAYKLGFKQAYIFTLIGVGIVCIIIRSISSMLQSKMSYLSSKDVKKVLRTLIFDKLMALGNKFRSESETSSLVQVSVEGVDQLEVYFGLYLPQFFYAMLAPIILFLVILTINVKVAVVLFICVPLIPISIMIVQKIAKKLLAKYWGKYTQLGDVFLENLQGLTTLKIYQSDEFKQKEMDEKAQEFRKITMRVLTMQLNSISIMDLIAYGGSAIGMIVALVAFNNGEINLISTLIIIYLSAEFFIPMRLLGSYFHIAMNGMAASKRIFDLLDIENDCLKDIQLDEQNGDIKIRDLSFAYQDSNVLNDINIDILSHQFIGIVGQSGSGKSTLAKLLLGKFNNYNGAIELNNCRIEKINNLNQHITYISHNAYLFKGSVKDNLLMANQMATDDQLIEVLKIVELYDFINENGGLQMPIMNNATNLSGGQRQRLAIARALLKDSNIYIFDEALSNIDVESEMAILKVINQLINNKMVIMISHRLENIKNADNIFVLHQGYLVEEGKHENLIKQNSHYALMYQQQKALEDYVMKGAI